MQGTIVITGGAGFLGRAIARRAERENWDARLIVYSRDELKQDQMRRRYKDVRYILGDVRDTEKLEAAFASADIVIHAAALKTSCAATGPMAARRRWTRSSAHGSRWSCGVSSRT